MPIIRNRVTKLEFAQTKN